jgi:NTP pyrophosphatase (non-canonical NTP hydrolase)
MNNGDSNFYTNCSGSYGFVLIDPDQPVRYDAFVAALFKPDNLRDSLNHAALGVAGEAGELVDAIKKHVIYGKPLDRANVVEELGDLRFYIQAVMNTLGISEYEILQENANKLRVRYAGLSYSSEAAIARADKATGQKD